MAAKRGAPIASEWSILEQDFRDLARDCATHDWTNVSSREDRLCRRASHLFAAALHFGQKPPGYELGELDADLLVSIEAENAKRGEPAETLQDYLHPCSGTGLFIGPPPAPIEPGTWWSGHGRAFFSWNVLVFVWLPTRHPEAFPSLKLEKLPPYARWLWVEPAEDRERLQLHDMVDYALAQAAACHLLANILYGSHEVGDPFRPAAWFGKKMSDRLRQAASKSRRTKRVRTLIIDGVVCYSVADARRWWPSDVPKDP